MKIQRKYFYLLTLIIGFFSNNIFAQENPHQLGNNNDITCINCHVLQPNITEAINTKNNHVDLNKFKKDGIEMCTTCHSEEEGHVVGVPLDFSVPADLPLGLDKSVSCLTCHYTHGSFESDRPQASYSFMDSLLNSERLHKSFLIRRNNVNGELCLTCHNTKQSKQQ